MKLALALALFGLALPAAAAGPACFQDCLRQGYERSQCLSLCERNSGGGPSLIEQPGAPRNPYLDALPDPVPRQQPLPARVDPRCLDDCKARGYQYGWCRKQCSY